MSDIFEETEENLRAEQWMRIARTTLPWISAGLAAALAIALGIWGWQSWQQHVATTASETYEAGIDAIAKADKATAKEKFAAAARAGNPTYKAMALMQMAGLASDDNDIAEAIKDLDEAAKATTNPVLSDTAAIKAAYLVMDTATYADIEKRLTPLTKDGRPASALAKEALAMARLQNGDVKGARAILSALSLTLGTPDGVKQRAGAAVVAIDSGSIETARAAVKLPEAAIATPAVQALPPGLEGLAQGAPH